jgi:hypothetical protein
MNRTLIVSVVALLVVVGVGAGIYFTFFASKVQVAVTTPGSTTLPLAGGTSSSGSQTTNSGTPTISSPGTPVTITNRLVLISTGPVVPGAVANDSKTGSASSSPTVALVNYIERQSGNVFSYRSDTHVLTRTNNRTIPGIQTAAWLPDGSAALVRYLSGATFSTINTYALSASTSAGFFLPQNLSDAAVSASGILTLASGVNGSVATLSHTDGTHGTTVFTTPLSSLRASFAGKNTYLAFSKPSASLPGDAFLVSGGRFSRIAGPLSGLVALASPSGKWVLVSYIANTTMQMELVNTVSGEVTRLPVATIADKCVWASDEKSVYCGVPQNPPAGTYPDDWYQGVTHFSDRIWNIHVTDHFAQMILDFSQAKKGALDATALALDPLNTTLVFTNAADDSLWSYSL